MRSRCTSVNLNPSSYLAICFNFVLSGRTARSSSFPPSSSDSSATTPRRRPCLSTDILTVRLCHLDLMSNTVLRFNMLNSYFILIIVQPAAKEDGWDTEPFVLTKSSDGSKLYGRGATDDKGPVTLFFLNICFTV